MKYIWFLLLVSVTLSAQKSYDFDCVLNVRELDISSNGHFTKSCYNKPYGITLVFDQYEGEMLDERKRYKVITQKVDDSHYIVKALESFPIRMHVRKQNGAFHIKALFYSPMYQRSESKYRRSKLDVFIKKIQATIDDKPCFDLQTTDWVSRNPFIKFKVLAEDGDELIKITSTDNNNFTNSKEINIANRVDRSLRRTATLDEKENPKAYRNKSRTIRKMYGNIKLIKNNVTLTSPNTASNPNSVPIGIKSSLQAKSVGLFMKDYQTKDYVLVAKWKLYDRSLINFNLKIRTSDYMVELMVIVEADDGKYYVDQKDIEFAIGGVG